MADEVAEALALDANPSTIVLRRPLAELARRWLPRTGVILEVGSGNGEHVIHLAARLPRLTWQPSDPDPVRRATIERWVSVTSAANVRAPLDLDLTREPWPADAAEGLLCCNVLHAAPEGAVIGLMTGAARVLPPGGTLLVCGLFEHPGSTPAVAAYDRRLRAHDPAWGVRTLDSLLGAARPHGLRVEDVSVLQGDHLALVLRCGPGATRVDAAGDAGGRSGLTR